MDADNHEIPWQTRNEQFQTCHIWFRHVPSNSPKKNSKRTFHNTEMVFWMSLEMVPTLLFGMSFLGPRIYPNRREREQSTLAMGDNLFMQSGVAIAISKSILPSLTSWMRLFRPALAAPRIIDSNSDNTSIEGFLNSIFCCKHGNTRSSSHGIGQLQ